MIEQALIEKSNAYREMFNTYAWKDFEANILMKQRIEALEDAVFATTMENVQLARGKVRCIDSIKSDLNGILEPHD